MGRASGHARPEVGTLVPMDTDVFLAWLDAAAAAIEANRDHLTQLDAAIGDADHGTNLARGFAAVTAAIEGAAPRPATPGAVLTLTGRTLISKVGRASGPLFRVAGGRARPLARPRPSTCPGWSRPWRPRWPAFSSWARPARETRRWWTRSPRPPARSARRSRKERRRAPRCPRAPGAPRGGGGG